MTEKTMTEKEVKLYGRRVSGYENGYIRNALYVGGSLFSITLFYPRYERGLHNELWLNREEGRWECITGPFTDKKGDSYYNLVGQGKVIQTKDIPGYREFQFVYKEFEPVYGLFRFPDLLEDWEHAVIPTPA